MRHEREQRPEDGRDARRWPWRLLAYHAAADAGFRRSDMRAFRVHQVHLKGLKPFIEFYGRNSKNGKYQTIPLTPSLAERMRAMVGDRKPGELVFSADAAEPSLPSVKQLHKDLARAGVEVEDGTGRTIDLHALRHTFVARMCRAGVHPRTAQELARHRDLMTTMKIYAQVGYLESTGAMDSLDRARTVPVSVPPTMPGGASSVPLVPPATGDHSPGRKAIG